LDLFTVNQQTCNQDGICVAVCPLGIIHIQKGDFPQPVSEADDLCIRCGHCVAVCPTGSLTHREMPVEQCPSVNRDYFLNVEQCEHFLRNRRSIRTYKNKSVSKEDLTKLIDMARYAPSGHNSQCVEWLVLSKKDELHRLAGIVIDWMHWMMKNMSEIALSLRMDRAIQRWESGIDGILREAPVVVVSHAEKNNRFAPAACTIALAYLELAATSMGLGCCWAGYFHASATTFPSMIETLALPNGHQCFGAMMVGYPKFNYHRFPTRKPANITWR
jgi:nitroreductase/NAD-dependent dihydropyrimidine dehydrogenase PreA subunit